MKGTPTLQAIPTGARRVIAVGGGKGGVGKSIVASNLAIALARSHCSVTLVDADFGAANLHTMFGIDRPGPGLGALLTGDAQQISQVCVPTAVPGLTLVPGAGAIPGAANFNHGQKRKILNQIRGINSDVVLVDVGAGVAFNTLDVFLLADQPCVVLTPQMTSIQNAYGFIKGAVQRLLRNLPLDKDVLALLLEEAAAREAEPVGAWLARVDQQKPEAGVLARKALAAFQVHIIGNQMFDDRDRGVLTAVSRMYRDFLDVGVTVLGALSASRRVHDSINQRHPLLLDDGTDENSRVFRHMAQALLAEDVAKVRAERDGFSRPASGALEEGEAPAA
jgi:flagellar biosynthesis protein FlhG